ncbi:MAG: hypothetical protein U0835_18145 [Isosphaeraceae bacterium]
MPKRGRADPEWRAVLSLHFRPPDSDEAAVVLTGALFEGQVLEPIEQVEDRDTAVVLDVLGLRRNPQNSTTLLCGPVGRQPARGEERLRDLALCSHEAHVQRVARGVKFRRGELRRELQPRGVFIMTQGRRQQDVVCHQPPGDHHGHPAENPDGPGALQEFPSAQIHE